MRRYSHTMGATTVLWCFGLFIWIHVSAQNYAGDMACTDKPQVSCGDNVCTCCTANDTAEELETGICVKTGLTYIPRMPDSVRYLIFVSNNLSAVKSPELVFSNVTEVEHLVLAWNSMCYFGPNVFSGLKNLRYLDIIGNFLTMESVRNMLSIPGLLSLSALHCDLPSPPANAFTNITSDVEIIILSSRHAGQVYDMTAFCSLSQLKVIALSLSKVINVTTTCSLQIEYLELRENGLHSLPISCSDKSESLFPHLKTLDMAGNSIDYVEKACLPASDALDLSENTFLVFESDRLKIKQFPNLRVLSLNSSTSLIWGVLSKAFSHPTLQCLVLDRCYIDFSDRGRVASDAFAGCPRLTVLSLMYNLFDDVDDARFLELFGSLNLTVLQLSHNKISLISWKIFDHFQNLRELDLVNTGLSDLPDGVFSSLRHLNWLDITDNKIATVTERTFSEEMRQELSLLGLGHNPFMCVCDLMWFRNWFVSQPTLFLDEDSSELEYACNNLAVTKLAEFYLTDQACVLSQSVNVAIILVTSAMIVTLTTVSLVFRFRWHIRLALYEVFRGRGDVKRMRLLADHFRYDVFVSYTSEDLPWVRAHLMPELEGRLGLRLCVHERDFIPGNNIVDNIADCVQSSKKILMVFSRDFVKHQWCQFELTFCLSHAMDYDDALIIVCVDDVVSSEMTSAMMAVLKITTYIQWEEFADAIEAFWGRLRLSMNEITGQIGP
uniref:Toll-like receptor 27.1 n=1 Tax=Littorina littorea TaxID=31216 RepID=A0A7G8ZA25_LITLI|nr:toll-like receptor 27.1 [Littorina littorea]